MDHPFCPLLHTNKKGNFCGVVKSYIHPKDVENICKDSEAFIYCVHYTNAMKKDQLSPKWNSLTVTKKKTCQKCRSTRLIDETVHFLLGDSQTPCEFKAIICEACGYTEFYRAR